MVQPKNSIIANSHPEYNAWRLDPSPDNMAAVLETMNPIINSEIQRYSGPKSILRAKARLLAIDAVRSYDPAHGAQLRSWVVTQLKPLSRYSQQLRPVYVPEVALRQGAEINRLKGELSDELGRDPTDEELADESGISLARIRQLKTKMRPAMSESAFMRAQDDENMSHAPATSMPDSVGMAKDIVYESLPEEDRKIFDLKTGKGGAPTPNQDIAGMLNLSAPRISQRSKAIADQINDLVTKGWV